MCLAFKNTKAFATLSSELQKQFVILPRRGFFAVLSVWLQSQASPDTRKRSRNCFYLFCGTWKLESADISMKSPKHKNTFPAELILKIWIIFLNNFFVNDVRCFKNYLLLHIFNNTHSSGIFWVRCLLIFNWFIRFISFYISRNVYYERKFHHHL